MESKEPDVPEAATGSGGRGPSDAPSSPPPPPPAAPATPPAPTPPPAAPATPPAATDPPPADGPEVLTPAFPAPDPIPDLTSTAPLAQTAASTPPPPPPGTATLVADPPPPPPEPTGRRSRGPLLVLGLALVALVAGLIAFAVAGDDGDDGEEAERPRDAVEQAGLADGDRDADDEPLGEVSEEVTGAPDPADPQAYGDDPELDRLHDLCQQGDMGACDKLYLDSGFGTAYEKFGDTCGNRNRSEGYCVDRYPASNAGPGTTVPNRARDGLADTSAITYGDDPDLDLFWDSCAAGDMVACDSLYLSSPAGTDYEVYGATCGQRNPVQGYCSEIYR